MSCAILVWLLVGCQTAEQSSRSHNSIEPDKQLAVGMTVLEACTRFGKDGEPLFAFYEEAEQAIYACTWTSIPDPWCTYYFLWKDGVLIDICSGASFSRDYLSAENSHNLLPFQQGSSGRLEDFEESELPSERDVGIVQWSGTLRTYFAHPSFYIRLKPEEVRAHLGPPDEVRGDPNTYGIWVIKDFRIPSIHGSLALSIGFRAGKSVWIEFGYDASAGLNGEQQR